MPNRVRIILHALTQLLGAVSCVTINANETTSAWAYRNRYIRPGPYQLINGLFFWQPDHCKAAVEREIASLIELAEVHGYTATVEKNV